MPGKHKSASYQPPPLLMTHRRAIGFCGNCGRARDVLQLQESTGTVQMCHECLLIAAEQLSGVSWLRNWKAIDDSRRLHARLLQERRAAVAE